MQTHSVYTPNEQFLVRLRAVTFASNFLMAYYTRVFCNSAQLPSAASAVAFANSESSQYYLAIDEETMDVFSNGSMAFEMKYKESLQPIVVEINKVDDVDPVAKGEIKEFIADIGFAGFSSAKRKVVNQLENTTFIVACRLLSDIDDDGYQANDAFLRYFINHCNGMLHADGEGFYDKDGALLVPDK